jgi:ubiquitin-like 1-activating enzyme E1 B
MAFNPDVKITAYHKNIKDESFDMTFFSKYQIVLNALDNIDARRHVNRLCLAFNIPLIESGTTGYIGQAMPILKKITECYECQPKLTQKVYPICTIRSTPSQPVHCIVWAKELFQLLYGKRLESLLHEPENDSTYMSLLLPLASSSTSYPLLSVPEAIDFSLRLFKAIFQTEIEKKKEMNLYTSSSHPPDPLPQSLFDEVREIAFEIFSPSSTSPPSLPTDRKGWERAVWNSVDCLLLLVHSVVTMTSTSLSASIGASLFDKDDRFSMVFVTAACSLRSEVFHIPTQSFHDAKGIAGNIIPAIASTNAIIASLQVVEAIRILSRSLSSSSSASSPNPITADQCRTTFCQRMPTRRGYYLQPTRSSLPNPSCFICGTSQMNVEVNLTKTLMSSNHIS